MKLSNQRQQSLYRQAIALAGVFQSAAMVDQIATKGSHDTDAFEVSIVSIFKQNASSVEDVFGGQVNYIPGLSLGFRQMQSILSGVQPSHRRQVGYVLGLLQLQRKLQRQTDLLEIIATRLGQLTPQLEQYSVADELIIGNLAGIYEDTLSTFQQRIQVTGDRVYLANPVNVDKVRALLLAGIRSAMLWHQVGGKRWHIVLLRNRLLQTIKTLT